MKDLHCHLLYGIDDGSKSLEESLTLLRKMEKAGVTECILTPHYVENSRYNCNNNEKETLFNEFQEEIKKEGINVKIYLGNEVFFTPNFLKLIRNKEILPLNKSKYILFEFPMNNIYNNTLEIVNELERKGYIPVLAHPERYTTFQRHPDSLSEYLKAGILMQGNLTSLFGKYGKVPEKTLKYFLKNKWITFLGSDTHHDVKYNHKKLEKKLLRITKDKDYVQCLLEGNFDKVINQEEIGIIR